MIQIHTDMGVGCFNVHNLCSLSYFIKNYNKSKGGGLFLLNVKVINIDFTKYQINENNSVDFLN